MKNHFIDLELIRNPKIFEDIHNIKYQFKLLFTDISNSLDPQSLSNIYDNSKGTKISMGNELNKCPYQVLDIFRNFDKAYGHNIRILNWWGHGLFIMVFFGKEMAKDKIIAAHRILSADYKLSNGNSPWDYKAMVNDHISPIYTIEAIDEHLKKFGYLQWYIQIPLHSDISFVKNEVLSKIHQIFRFHTY